MPHQGNSHKETRQFFTILLNTALLGHISADLSLPLSAHMRSGTKCKIHDESLSFSQYKKNCKGYVLMQFSARNLLIVFVGMVTHHWK